MKGNLLRIVIMEREDLSTVMETCMKEIGLTARQKEKASTTTTTDQHIKDNEKMMSNEVSERKNGQTVPSMSENTKVERRTEKVCSSGVTDRLTKETSTKTTSTAKVCIFGLITENTMANGK